MTYTATKIQWFGVFLNFTKYVQMSLVFQSVCKESMGGGGGGAESARADFNYREIP